MKTKIERELKSQFDACRTECRKLNVNFSEAAFKRAWRAAVDYPEYYRLKIEVDKYGRMTPERR